MRVSRVNHFRHMVRLLKRNAFRLAAVFLLIQVFYIFIKLNMQLSAHNGRPYRYRGDASSMYNYVYDNDLVKNPAGRRQAGIGMRRRDADGAAAAGKGKDGDVQGGIQIQYIEDYDQLGGEPDVVIQNKQDQAKEDIPDELKPIDERPEEQAPIKLAPIRAHAKPEPKAIQEPDKTNKDVNYCSVEERAQHLRKYCNVTSVGDNRPKNFKKNRYGNLLVDEKHKLVFCDITQPASLVWATIIAEATGQVRTNKPPVRFKKYMAKLGLYYLDTYDDAKRDEILKEYYKFMIVQHPFDRMMTVWRTRLFDSLPDDSWRKKLGRQIILAQRKINNRPVTAEELTIYDTARLEEFLEYAFVDRDMQDPSWFTYLSVCHPCEIQYDAILRAETLKNDAEEIFSRMAEDYWEGIPREIPVPVHLDLTKDETVIEQYTNTSDAAQAKLFEKYKHDMGMFGYTWDTKKKTAACNIAKSSKESCC